MSIEGKKILIGISGGIAAYKIHYLIRHLIKSGAKVKVVATANALQFVTPTSLETLSQNKIYTDLFGEINEYSTEHISLTDWADLLIVAPATANIIGKIANGIADDVLSTTFLAFNGPVLIAPAMNVKMYQHYAVVRNMNYLQEHGVNFIRGQSGDLACGYQGEGRMAEPEEIFEAARCLLLASKRLKGKKVLVTASRTEEALDPVRYLTNRSSGKTGFEIARAFSLLGAEVLLISGPSREKTPPGVKRIDIVSAQEMFEAVSQHWPEQDALIMSAAVADYTFVYNEQKIKKNEAEFSLQLVKTKDILQEAGAAKKAGQILVGFALETENLLENALQKLRKKIWIW